MYFYILWNQDTLYLKIGITEKSVKHRLNQIINASGCKIDLLFSCKCEKANIAESYLKKCLGMFTVAGEWYDLDRAIFEWFIPTINGLFQSADMVEENRYYYPDFMAYEYFIDRALLGDIARFYEVKVG